MPCLQPHTTAVFFRGSAWAIGKIQSIPASTGLLCFGSPFHIPWPVSSLPCSCLLWSFRCRSSEHTLLQRSASGNFYICGRQQANMRAAPLGRRSGRRKLIFAEHYSLHSCTRHCTCIISLALTQQVHRYHSYTWNPWREREETQVHVLKWLFVTQCTLLIWRGSFPILPFVSKESNKHAFAIWYYRSNISHVYVCDCVWWN